MPLIDWTGYAGGCLVVGAVGLVALLVSERRGYRPGVVLGKLTASSCFVLFALAIGGEYVLENAIAGWIFLGLLLCWLGDALLLPPGQSLWFRLGIGAFLLGHVAYAIAFLSSGVDGTALAAAAVAMAAVAGAAVRWLTPHRPDDFRVPVLCYVVVIAIMVTCAVGATAHGASPAIGLGALAFAASDLSVARERFVVPSFINSAWGLPLYYVAQFLIASGIADLPAR